MELFLLFSLALTFVAFLSIVLAEPPTPFTIGNEVELQFGRVVPITIAQNDPGNGSTGNALDTEQTPTAATVAVEEQLQVMF